MVFDYETVPFESLLGKTVVEITGMLPGSSVIEFTCSDGVKYQMMHIQDCCEYVTCDDVVGDHADLLNSPITMAIESCSGEDPLYECDSFTWTFYKLATVKGFVDIKWRGESNGYYSESANFVKLR